MKSQFSITIEEWRKLTDDGAKIPVSFVINGDSMRPSMRLGQDTVTAVPVYRELKKATLLYL